MGHPTPIHGQHRISRTSWASFTANLKSVKTLVGIFIGYQTHYRHHRSVLATKAKSDIKVKPEVKGKAHKLIKGKVPRLKVVIKKSD